MPDPSIATHRRLWSPASRFDSRFDSRLATRDSRRSTPCQALGLIAWIWLQDVTVGMRLQALEPHGSLARAVRSDHRWWTVCEQACEQTVWSGIRPSRQ